MHASSPTALSSASSRDLPARQSGAGATTPPVVSAEDLHRILAETYLIGNRARRAFIAALRAMAEARLYLTFGFSSIVGYAERYFGLPRSQTYEYLRVAEALERLPGVERAFEEGTLSWSAVRDISRVASATTESEWLSFKDEHTLAELRAEVKDALEKRRDRPRRGSHGLPNLTVAVPFRLTREEYERVAQAFDKLAGEIGSRLEQGGADWKEVLLFVAERVLATDPPEELGGRVESERSPYTILYHVCPDCRRAKLSTGEGPVEVPASAVERIEGAAERLEITPEEELPAAADGGREGEAPAGAVDRDRPNPPALSRKVRLRDGGVCSNPLCRRRGPLHAHHIEFRARGGRTRLANETALCATCHALVHQGALEIGGDPLSGLRFRARGAATPLAAVRRALTPSGRFPRVVTVEAHTRESAIADSCASAAGKSRHRDSRRSPERDDLDTHGALVGALERLGYCAAEARGRIEEAIAKLEARREGASLDGELLEAEILREALRLP